MLGSRTTRILLSAGALLLAPPSCTDLTEPTESLPTDGPSAAAAEGQSIAADFNEGQGTSSSDQFPGTSGGGWATGWEEAQTRADVERSVVNTHPLRGNGNYLSIDQTATDTGGVTRITRRYQSSEDVDVDGDHQVRFDFRLDSADDFNTGTDIIAFFARRSDDRTGAGGTNGSDTWAIRTSGSAGVWAVMDGAEEIRTDVRVTAGVVYTFIIDFDVATNAYSASILVDGDEQFTESGLSYRNDAEDGPGTYIHVHSRVSDRGQNLRYSFDSLRITSEEDPGNGNGGSSNPDGIAVDFEDGAGTSSSDQFPGRSGGGWTSAWRTAQTRSNVSRSVVNTNRLDGNGNYLSIEHVASDSGAATRITRRYESSGDVDVEADHQIRFDFRLDSADDFSTRGDIISFFARRSNPPTGAGGPNPLDTWAIRATGEGRVWLVRDGGNYVSTDVPVTTGAVYTFVIDVDAAADKYALSILVNGTEEFADDGVAYRNDESTGTGTYVHVHSRVSNAGQAVRYSFDSLRITSDGDPGNGNGGTPDPDAIDARFDEGEGTSSLDQFPGRSGGGWATAWQTAATRSSVTRSVVNANPLRGNGNYLSIDHTANSTKGVTRITRQYRSVQDVDVGATHQIQFDFRLDSENTTEDDLIAFFARRTDPPTGAGEGPNRLDTWEILAAGNDGVWMVRDGDGRITTGVPVTAGAVYTFVLDLGTDAYRLTILVDGTEEFSEKGLAYRNNEAEGPGTYFHLHSRASSPGQSLRYSFDSVHIVEGGDPGEGNGNGDPGNGNGGDPPNGDRPNEPAGFQRWAEHDFSSLPDGELSHAGVANTDFAANYTIVSDPSTSDGSALRIRFPEGQSDGVSPGRFFVFDRSGSQQSTPLSEWYVSLWIMLEEHPDGGWETPPSAQKLWYNGIGRRGLANRGGHVMLSHGGGANEIADSFRTRVHARRSPNAVATGYQDNQGVGPHIYPGQWHHIEFYGTASTPGQADGVYRMWVDGVLVNDRADVQNQDPDDWGTGFFEFHWAPVWGGVCSGGCPKRRTDHMRVDHLYVSGKPQ